MTRSIPSALYRILHRLLPGLVAGLLLPPVLAGSPAKDPVALGKRIYREGILPDGRPLAATVLGDVDVEPRQTHCVFCHRTSGYGSSEGELVIPAVTREVLFNPVEIARRELYARRTRGAVTRPAYTAATLKRAIRAGIDPAGRTLSPLMPRYALSEQAADSLVAYLRTLSARSAPGVTATEMHIATIVTDGVTPAQRKTLLNVMQTFVHDRDMATRNQRGRARHAPWHRDWIYQSWRDWRLHVWNLHGAPDGWQAQLEALYRRQPVYFVLGGVARGSWAPIQAFCRRQEVPCLFPSADLPAAKTDFYTVYLSQGMLAEARVLAQRLRAQGVRQLTQLYRPGTEGATAARLLRRALAGSTIQVHDRAWPEQGGPSPVEPPRGTSVCWLRLDDLKALPWEKGRDRAPVYLSGTLLFDRWQQLPRSLRHRARLLYPFELPGKTRAGMARPLTWAHLHRVLAPDRRVLGDSFFALSMVGSLVKKMRDQFSKEYLVERLEHMVDNTLVFSLYPHLGLGPDQRFASEGCYVTRIEGSPPHLVAIGDWRVPEVSAQSRQ